MTTQPRFTYFDADADNTATAVKTVAGRVRGIEASNPNTIDAYVQFFDLATGDVTVGTTTPEQSFLVPGGASSTLVGAMDKNFGEDGVDFQTAITVACTTTATGSTDPTTGLVLNIQYD